MESSPTQKASERDGRQRWVFHYGVEGDIRFLGHRDMLRLFERALVRTALPVKYTEGFNPHARLSIPLPRPVGVASSDEAVLIEFEEPIDGEDAATKLNETIPPGLKIVNARKLDVGERLHPASAHYRLEFSDAVEETVQSVIREVLRSEVVMVQRRNPKSGHERPVDIRPSIVDLRLNGEAVDFVLRNTPGGTAKPAEIAALLGLDPNAINHRIRRTEIQWQ